MKQLRKTIALLLALALCLTLVACGVSESKAALDDFVGFWMYENIDIAVTINDDGTWYYDWMEDDMENHEGTAKIRDGKLELLENGEAYAVLTLRDVDTLIDEDGDILLRTDPSDTPDISDTVEEDFYGIWKYDAYDQVFVINDDFTWDMYDTEANYAGSAEYEYSDGTVTLLDGAGNAAITLYYVNGQLMDSDGDTISAYEFVFDDSEDLPSPADPLTQSIVMEDSPIPLEIYYPETMEGHAQAGIDRRLSFNAINGAGTDEDFTNINFNMVNIGSSYDSYMGKGFNSAKSGMQKILDGILAQYYPNGELLKSIGTDFIDGGTYYDITGYLWLDGSAFLNPASQPVRATCTVRYVGPVGYVLVAVALAIEPRIQTYYEICQKMLGAIDFGGDWSTTPKAVSGGGAGGAWSDTGDYGTAYYWTDADGAWSDTGDYGTAYYWTDADGDVWYWNGYEDVFIGFGSDYYVDGNQYYESNDAGWDYSDDYYDDYDPWSDPGDGDDFWSDPGDTDYYEDDGEYYEAQDYDW